MAFKDDIHQELVRFRHLEAESRKAQLRITNSNVLVSGMQGLGAEIAKNLIINGVKSVTLHDEGLVELWDLSGNFIFTENDFGKNRAVVSVERLQELNKDVAVSALSTGLTTDQLSGFQAVVFTDIGLEKAIELNTYCHNHQPPIAFIKAEIRGLFASVFCDFGPTFDVLDDDGDDPCSTSISNSNPAHVGCVEGKSENEDMVVFSGVSDKKRRKILETRPNSFTHDEKGGIVTKVKQPTVATCKPLEEAIIDPVFLPGSVRTPLLHLAFRALDQFVSEQGGLPRSRSEEDAQKLIYIVRNLNNNLVSDRKVEDINPKLLEQFAFGSWAVLSPMAAIFGGVVGQDVRTACSGKSTPYQFYYFDSVPPLPNEPLEAAEFMPLNSRYDAQISVFGNTFQKKLQDAKVFVVGSDELGCEFLKNLALMGVSCGEKGKLTITDDDVIWKHHLSSHFLFREEHIGMPKTVVAAVVTRVWINQQLNTEALQDRVVRENEDVFDNAFWERIDVVVNALDDLVSKEYVDQRCLRLRKPFIVSATQLTPERYGILRDPPMQFNKNDGRHTDLIPTTGNTRQREVSLSQYYLPEIENMKARLLAAGKLSSRGATSTSIATGLACLELYQVLDGGRKIEDYEAQWVIKDNPTIEELFEWVAKKGFEACGVIFEDTTIYYKFFPWLDDCWKEKVVDVVRRTTNVEIPPHCSHIDVTVTYENERKQSAHLPLVSVYFRELEETVTEE